MGQAEIILIYNVYRETNPLVIKILQKEENNLVQYCHAAFKVIYTNIKLICQILWEYMTLILLFIEYFFLCWLSKRIDRGAKTWCTHAALWLAGFIVCQCWSSSVTPCSKHLDFPTSHPVLSPYLSSKALYRRHESRDTHLRISQSPQLFFQASVSDERALSLQSFALEICQLSHYGITETL